MRLAKCSRLSMSQKDTQTNQDEYVCTYEYEYR